MWNWLDFTLVVLNLVDAVAWTLLSEGGADMTFMRAIRILRLSRILRGLRLMRFFAELRVMLNSLLGLRCGGPKHSHGTHSNAPPPPVTRKHDSERAAKLATTRPGSLVRDDVSPRGCD